MMCEVIYEDNIKKCYPEIVLWASTVIPLYSFDLQLLTIFEDNTFFLRYYSTINDSFFETPIIPMEFVENFQLVREYKLKKTIEDLLND